MCGQVGLLWRCGIWLAIEVDFSFLCFISFFWFGAFEVSIRHHCTHAVDSSFLVLFFRARPVVPDIRRFWVGRRGSWVSGGKGQRGGTGNAGVGSVMGMRASCFERRLRLGLPFRFRPWDGVFLQGVLEGFGVQEQTDAGSARSNVIR